jgi:hypothetical protein
MSNGNRDPLDKLGAGSSASRELHPRFAQDDGPLAHHLSLNAQRLSLNAHRSVTVIHATVFACAFRSDTVTSTR